MEKRKQADPLGFVFGCRLPISRPKLVEIGQLRIKVSHLRLEELGEKGNFR